jgi:hypothetical protein
MVNPIHPKIVIYEQPFEPSPEKRYRVSQLPLNALNTLKLPVDPCSRFSKIHRLDSNRTNFSGAIENSLKLLDCLFLSSDLYLLQLFLPLSSTEPIAVYKAFPLCRNLPPAPLCSQLSSPQFSNRFQWQETPEYFLNLNNNTAN